MKGSTEVLEWLLEPDQPSVQAKALVELAGHRRDSVEVKEARARISKSGWAASILAQQDARGRWEWEARKSLYVPKYICTVWNLIMLADLGLDRSNPGVRKASELFLEDYARPDGGFDTPSSEWRRSELCLTGHLARTLTLSGDADDPRVRASFDWLVRNQMKDGGWHCFYEKAFGRGTLDCWEGLSAFAVLPRSRWTRSIKRSVERGAEFYLSRNLFRQGRRYLPWFRYHYPVHYYYDVLVGLDVLTSLGYGSDRRLDPALEIMMSKRKKDDRWVLDAVHPDLGAGAGYRLSNKRVTPFALETKGGPSKWITLTCMSVLKRVDEAR